MVDWLDGRADRFRCRAGFRGRSVARRPCKEIDRDAKTSWWDIWKDGAAHSGEMCEGVNVP